MAVQDEDIDLPLHGLSQEFAEHGGSGYGPAEVVQLVVEIFSEGLIMLAMTMRLCGTPDLFSIGIMISSF
jgi:hypothetical protein